MQKVKASPGNLFNVYKGDNTKIYDLPADASVKMENMYLKCTTPKQITEKEPFH